MPICVTTGSLAGVLLLASLVTAGRRNRNGPATRLTAIRQAGSWIHHLATAFTVAAAARPTTAYGGWKAAPRTTGPADGAG